MGGARKIRRQKSDVSRVLVSRLSVSMKANCLYFSSIAFRITFARLVRNTFTPVQSLGCRVSGDPKCIGNILNCDFFFRHVSDFTSNDQVHTKVRCFIQSLMTSEYLKSNV